MAWKESRTRPVSLHAAAPVRNVADQRDIAGRRAPGMDQRGPQMESVTPPSSRERNRTLRTLVPGPTLYIGNPLFLKNTRAGGPLPSLGWREVFLEFGSPLAAAGSWAPGAVKDEPFALAMSESGDPRRFLYVPQSKHSSGSRSSWFCRYSDIVPQ